MIYRQECQGDLRSVDAKDGRVPPFWPSVTCGIVLGDNKRCRLGTTSWCNVTDLDRLGKR